MSALTLVRSAIPRPAVHIGGRRVCNRRGRRQPFTWCADAAPMREADVDTPTEMEMQVIVSTREVAQILHQIQEIPTSANAILAALRNEAVPCIMRVAASQLSRQTFHVVREMMVMSHHRRRRRRMTRRIHILLRNKPDEHSLNRPSLMFYRHSRTLRFWVKVHMNPGAPPSSRAVSDAVFASLLKNLRNDHAAEAACPICLETFAQHDEVASMPCDHAFHRDCLRKWLDMSTRCPCCRFALSGGEPASPASSPRYIGEEYTGDRRTRSTPVPGLRDVVQLALYGASTLARHRNGTVSAFGDNSSGRLGFVGDTDHQPTPRIIPNLCDGVQLSAEDGEVAYVFGMVHENGTVTTVCNNYDAEVTATIVVPGLHNVVQIVTTNSYTLALHRDGTASSFENDMYSSRRKPVSIPGLSNVTRLHLYADLSSVLALHCDGTVSVCERRYDDSAWSNSDEDNAPSLWSTPTVVAGLTDVTRLATGNRCRGWALHRDGTVSVFYPSPGYSPHGASSTPTVVPGLVDVAQLAIGCTHTLALHRNGTVSAMGGNHTGQLGLGDTVDRECPCVIPGLTDVVHVVAISCSTLALHRDGTVSAFGSNEHGQLGVGDTEPRLAPTMVPNLGDVVQLTCSVNCTMALHHDGTVSAFGTLTPSHNGLDGDALNDYDHSGTEDDEDWVGDIANEAVQHSEYDHDPVVDPVDPFDILVVQIKSQMYCRRCTYTSYTTQRTVCAPPDTTRYKRAPGWGGSVRGT